MKNLQKLSAGLGFAALLMIGTPPGTFTPPTTPTQPYPTLSPVPTIGDPVDLTPWGFTDLPQLGL
jgi:hypothetical protein